MVEYWWFPTFIFLVSILFLFITSDMEVIPSFVFPLIGLAFLFVSGVLQLFHKKWLPGIFNLGLTFFAVFLFGIFVLSFAALFGPDTDTFADDLELPENVALNYPLDLIMGDDFEMIRPELEKEVGDNYFQLYNSFQPGIYEYDVWIDSKESGTVYLKAYEITKGTQLSDPYLRRRSSIRIGATNGEVTKFGTKEDFTIYEGDWGKPYGARFEIWFDPDGEGNDRMLFEKNYVIEGWMR